MESNKILEYLLANHYNEADVLAAISPYTDYQEYLLNRNYNNNDEIVMAFGTKSGQKLHARDAWQIIVDDKYYYISPSDMFRMSNSQLIEIDKPSDNILCAYTDSTRVFHPDDLIFTHDNNWLPRISCIAIEDDYYNDCDELDIDYKPIYVHKAKAQQTHDGEWILAEDAVYCQSDACYYHEDSEGLYYSDTCDYWIHVEDDNVRYCEDISQWILQDDAHYDNITDTYVYDRDNLTCRDHTQSIQDYHCGIEPAFNLTALDKNSVLSKYTVGFEVEKDCLRDGNNECGSLIEQQPLFSHWETDSSCGIEGITNVYTLDNYVEFIDDVRNSDYTDLETNSRCGGHINIAHREGKMQYWHLRPWLGLIFSMWKKRLTNQYSSCNKKANPYRATDYHYGVLVEKGRNRSANHPSGARYELRLPSKVKDGDTLIRRFCLMQKFAECVDLYINEDFAWMAAKYDDDITKGIPNWMHDDLNTGYDKTIAELMLHISPQTRQRTRFFFEKAQSIIKDAYQPEEYKRVLAYAYAFQSYIDEERVPDVVRNLTDAYINS